MNPRLVLAGAAVWLLGGCAAPHFRPAGAAPEPPPRYRLEAWPVREYWSGLVFNGEKIGFSHLALAPAAEPGHFEIRSEAAFALRFLGFDKRVNLKAVDVVRADLDLVSFRYDYEIDGARLLLAGERRDGALAYTVTRAGEATAHVLPAGGRLYPQSAIGLYPSLHGLAPGREYRYRVFSGELQKVGEVTQRIAGYERSELFAGEAFRVQTALDGYEVITWLSARGAPVLEIGMNGVLIAGLEDEARARGYLVAASLGKSEALVAFSLARPAQPIERPREVTGLRIALSGAQRAVPSDGLQRCSREGGETVCDVRTGEAGPGEGSEPRHLASSFTVPARHPAIASRAREIAAGAAGDRERVGRVLEWIAANVRLSPADAWTALDVLERREAECQGHAWLDAALARALAIPTRVVNGIVYSEDHDGFLFHTWAESLVEGRWLPVDPAFRAVPADATHVKLVEGEGLADLLPLVDWVGRLQVRVLAVERGYQDRGSMR